MKRKLLSILLIGVMVIGLTGCGKKVFEYTENMKEMRSYTAGYIDNKTIGEVLDVAIVDAEWSETEKQGATVSGRIFVKGKDKKSGNNVELIWKTSLDMYDDNGFESFTKDGEELTYGQFLDYLKDYVDEVK